MKTIISKYSILMAGAAMTLGLGACSDQLDIDQHGTLTTETYYNTDQDAREATTAIYVTMNSGMGAFEAYPTFIKILLSNDVWGLAAAHDSEWAQMTDLCYDPACSFVGNAFQSYYNVVGSCNAVIDNVQPDTPVKKQAVAEAKTIRAWMYFELASLWGNPPIVDHVPASIAETQIGNSEPEQLWAFIIGDLNEAIASGALPQKERVDDNTQYHVTKQYAQALLGKAYLWSKQYDKAADTYDEVIGSGLYDLYRGDFQDILTSKCDNCCESLFELNSVLDDANLGNCFRLLPTFYGLPFGYFNFGDNTENLRAQGGSLGFAKQNLYDAFMAEEGKDGYRFNQSIKDFEWLNKHGYALNTGMQLFVDPYFIWKFREPAEDFNPKQITDCQTNARCMRYAEVLLCAAEANVMAGRQAQANICLNNVRTRAKLPFKEATLEAVKTEKRLEFAGEGLRYQDLIRWGDAATALADMGKRYPVVNSSNIVEYRELGSECGFRDKHNRLPYPTIEMSVNHALVQNPGW